MASHEPSRRDVLRTGAALSGLATLGSLAGCAGLLNSENPGTGEDLTGVPESADAAAHADAAAVIDDDGTRSVVDAMLGVQAEKSWYSGPEDFEGMLSDFEAETGLDPDGVETVTPFFAWRSDSSYGSASREFYGMLFEADWDEDAVVDSLEDSYYDFEETDHADRPVYEPEYEHGNWIGVVADGEYVIGSEDAVKDAIDVEHGDEDAMDENLRTAYADARSGPVAFVGTVPTDQLPDTSGPDDEFDLTTLDDVETVAGAVYENGDNRGVETTFAAEDEDTAEDLASLLDGLFAFASDQAGDGALGSELDAVEVGQDGTDVVVSYEAAVAELVDVVEEAMASDSGGGRAVETPQVAFSFEYEATGDGTGTVAITHDGGDTVRQSELYVRGTGFADVSGVDMTAGGQWAGSTNRDLDDGPAVVAGDRVTLGVESDGELRVIYEASDGDTSATLAAWEGPDA
ncbi:twin-arginine translocation signal domain-containing protein [Halorientalis salina]|uniref:twin-arginine translocation signal domain-containing protein n=1 Tax=Halorientalis salina TaxID=2932266 RepID=UPI0010ACE484|nr:twin-arginine translocation signal domain-containing protein [Halorientalis salina]